MEVLELLDRLESLISTARRVPFTGRVLVNEEEVYTILDEIRQAFPEELRQARWLAKERERFLAGAREEADNLVQEARNYVARMAEESAVTQKAQERAEEILEEARRIAREIKQGAREYANEVLSRVEGSLARTVETIRQSREQLQLKQQG